MRGRFIVVEGLDGAGSTTQCGLIAEFIRSLGYQVHETREPSRGAFGSLLRDAIEGVTDYSPELLALGFAADRLDHMTGEDGIQQHLEKGSWVISDRYLPSALAYQAAQGVEMEWLISINRFAPTPDATVFVDTPVSTCLTRIASRDTNQGDLFHRRTALYAIRKEYIKVLTNRDCVGELISINGALSLQKVANDAIKGLSDVFSDELGLFVQLADLFDGSSVSELRGVMS